MATYPPPNFLEPLDEFNVSNWISTQPTTSADNLTAVLTAGDDAGGLNITNLNQLSSTGTTTLAGSVNFTNVGVGSLTSLATQPAYSDNSTKIPTTAWVQNAIVNSAINSIYTIQSDNANTTTWTFTGIEHIINTQNISYSFNLYSNTNENNYVENNMSSSNYIISNIVNNNTTLVCSGLLLRQTYEGITQNYITYCSGFQENYHLTAYGTAYIPHITTCNVALTSIVNSNQIGENQNTCPPTASSNFTSVITFTSPTPINSTNIVMVIRAI